MDTRPDWQAKLFNQRLAGTMQQEYYDKTRDFEMRQQYGILDQGGVRAYNATLSGISHDMVSGLRQVEVQDYQNTAKASAQNGDVSSPVLVTSGLTSFYFGNPLDVALAPDTKLWAQANIPSQTGELRVNSPVVNTDLSMNASALTQPGPNGLPAMDPTTGQPYERYKVSVTRPLPLWDMSAGATYGGSSSTVRASLSKPIVGNLTGVVESVRPLSAMAAAAGAPNEQTVRVLYGLSF